MSNTRRTHANSPGHSGQPSTTVPSGSTPQAANAALSALAKSHQHTKFNLHPLDNNGDNYTQWHKMITLMLKFKGLWDIIDGSTPVPASTDAQAHLDWTQRDQEAQLQIMSTLNNMPLNHVLDAKTAKEAWDLLKVCYQGDDDLHTAYLLEHLFTITFHNTDPMELQIADVVSIACQLTDIGFSISDQLLAGAIRVKLLKSWNMLKTVLANTGGTVQSSKGVISQILAKEHHLVHAKGGDTTVYYARSTPKGKKKPKQCSHCKYKGHTASECRKHDAEENPALNTLSGKTLGKSLSRKPSSGKSLSKGSSFKSSSRRPTNSTKIVAADSDSGSGSRSDSNDTVQVFIACATTGEDVKHVYKTKAKLHQCNLQDRWLIDSGVTQTMCSH